MQHGHGMYTTGTCLIDMGMQHGHTVWNMQQGYSAWANQHRHTVRGILPNKLNSINKKTRKGGRIIFISQDFLWSCYWSSHTFQLAQTTSGRPWHNHQRWWSLMVLVTPSKAFLILFWFKMIPSGPPSLVKQEKVGQCQVWGIGQVLQVLEPFRHHLLLYAGRSILYTRLVHCPSETTMAAGP